MSRTHYDVEIEHYLTKLLDRTDNDFAYILKHFGVDRARLNRELQEALDTLKTGNARTPALSPSLVRMLSDAWMVGSVEFGDGGIRTGYTVLSLMSSDELRRLIVGAVSELDKISAEQLRSDFQAIVADSYEVESVGAAGAGPVGPNASGSATPNLDQFTIDLTERARAGELDPVLGRDWEIRQCVDVLTRRRQNNPILVGEAGVGKSAVVEGFASRIASGDVPEPLRNVSVRSLDLALLQAGAGVKGEFESRLKKLIAEVKSSPTPIILFIDEAHTLIGAGGAAGQGDAANLLKPALARGELRTVAATTWSEYKKHLEKDPALSRRFQVVKVDEPSEDACLVMMRGIVPALEGHHGVRILADGLEAAVRLSARYLTDRQLPDKAVSVLDTACARLALGQNTTPAPFEAATRRLQDLDVQARVLKREAATGADHSERLAEIEKEKVALDALLEELGARWSEERDLVQKIRGIREELEGAASDEDSDGVSNPDDLRKQLAELEKKLEDIQGEDPLVSVAVDAELVGQVISGWTGIPVGKMMRDEVTMALELEKHLQGRVIGQDHAMEVLSHRIRSSKAGIEDPGKPVGVFMLAGPSGVGKTESALTLSDLLYGGEKNLISINMSEFQEPHTVSTLKGSPPGYVGYGEGGVLTEAVRRRPYSVVLLDEVEKAHPDVLELFFQVFDKGRMEDGEGREIDFTNTTIVLTTNAASDTIMKLTSDPETMPSPTALVTAIKPELDDVFKPAFLGRCVIVPFYPVRDDALKQIIRLKLGKIQRRLDESHGIELTVNDELVDEIASRCTEVESGARNVDNILTNTLLPDLSKMLLESLVAGEEIGSITVRAGENGGFAYEGQPRATRSEATASA